MDDQAVKAAIRSVKAVYPNAFAERCANGGCVIRQSLQRGIVIGYVSPGDHIAAWLDAARRISEGHNAKAQAGSVAENRYQPKGQSISPDGTGGFMTEKNTSFIDFLETHPARLASDSTKKWLAEFYLAGYAAGECAARQQFTHLYHAVNELMAYMGAHGSAEARGDRAQAVMDALHAIDGGQYQTAKEPTT
jgi:hypothetical protein